MMVAELRYLLAYVALGAVFLVPVVTSVLIGRIAHMPLAMTTFLCFPFIAALGWAACTVWWRNRKRLESATPARYAPIIFPLAFLCVEVYWIASSIPQLQAVKWKEGIGTFASLCLSTSAFAFFTLKAWRSRYLELAPASVPAFTQARLEQFATALQMPTAAERKRAMRPLIVRRNIRLALLIAPLALIPVLAPHVGAAAATAGSVLASAVLFLAGHKFFDL